MVIYSLILRLSVLLDPFEQILTTAAAAEKEKKFRQISMSTDKFFTSRKAWNPTATNPLDV